MGIKFESVRITHAQSVPDHYFANQVYQPIDEDHRENGSFFILFDQQGSPDAIFIASLVNTLIREYYRSPLQDRLSCFEQTLLRLNDQIKQYANKRESTLSITLNGIVVLCLGKEIHITYIGNPYAVLMRNNEVLPLIDKVDESDSNGVFSLITSGEVFEGDLLILLTQSFGDSIKDDVIFALSHDPIHEAGRAFARILKQKTSQLIEGQFLHFTPGAEETFPVYLDRPLETSTERVAHYRQAVAKQGNYLLQGLSVGKEKISSLRDKKTPPTEPALTPNEKNQPDEEIVSAPPRHSMANPVQLEKKSDSEEFSVRNYWQSRPTPREETPNLTTTRYTVQTPAAKKQFHLKPRTIYLLIGILAVMFILIRVINAVSSDKTSPKTETVDRAAIIASATAKEREAETARLQNNSVSAIENYLTALTELKEIPDSQANEESKALSHRIQSTLDDLTDTTRVEKAEKTIEADTDITKIVAAGETIFAILDQAVSKLEGDTLKSAAIPDSPGEIFDAISLDKGTKVALLTGSDEELKLYLGDVKNNSFTIQKRADAKPWPIAHLLTSYDKNIYFVGDTISKATPRDNGYRITPFAAEVQTDAVTSITERDGFFYAIENNTSLIRIDAKGPKTVVSIHGVPESFLPTQMQLISGSDDTLWLIDTKEHRLVNITTDGAYKSQKILPDETEHTSCSIAASKLFCSTTSKTVVEYKLK